MNPKQTSERAPDHGIEAWTSIGRSLEHLFQRF